MRNGLHRVFSAIFVAAAITPHFVSLPVHSQVAAKSLTVTHVHAERLATTDLELAGDLKGLPAGVIRYVSREDLLALPQVTFTVSDDSNFKGPTEISGVLLEDVIKSFAGAPSADLAVAICDDEYRAHYPRAYLAAHHPVLVLKINGQPPSEWPKDAGGGGQAMGPYMISHREFKPGIRILKHQEEAQIPWGVLRLEFRNEKAVFDSIAPRGQGRSSAAVQAGYRIAQQNCLRCHNMGQYGGQKAQHPWLVLSAWAATSPGYFAGYVRNPQSENPHARMPGNPNYDVETFKALIAYFKTFSFPLPPSSVSSGLSSKREKP